MEPLRPLSLGKTGVSPAEVERQGHRVLRRREGFKRQELRSPGGKYGDLGDKGARIPEGRSEGFWEIEVGDPRNSGVRVPTESPRSQG